MNGLALAMADYSGHQSTMDYLFIVTYGRSGSTALQNVLNCLPGYCIRGENGGAFNHLVGFRTAISWAKSENPEDASSPSDPWYGLTDISLQSIDDKIVSLLGSEVLRSPLGTEVTGFKEIRYTPEHLNDEEFANVMHFMLNKMNGRIIFNTRNASEVARSGWWKKMPVSKVSDIIERSNRRFEQYKGDRTFMIDHSQYNGNPDGFTPLLEWLGADVSIEHISEAVNVRLNHLKDSPKNKKRIRDLFPKRFVRLIRSLKRRFS
jgi:hypothetical protein